MDKAVVITTNSGESGKVKEVKGNGNVTVKFLKGFGSYKKGDEQSYHITTVKSLVANKTCKIVE